MIRSDLVRLLAERRKLDAARAEKIVAILLDGIGSALGRGERFEVRGFGTFSVRRHRSYAGRHPKTGAPIEVKAKTFPRFKPSRELTVRMNEAARGPSAQSASAASSVAGTSSEEVLPPKRRRRPGDSSRAPSRGR